jgi:hypothetical protein
MKNFLLYGLLLLFFYDANSQTLIIKGRVKCMNPGVNSTKGAENILVVPTFLPSKSTITVTRPSGYFEFNTGMPFPMLQDKQINLYTISRCSQCKEIARRVFISEDQDRQNKADAKSYVTIKDWTLNTSCAQAEMRPFSADSLLAVITKQAGQNLDNVSASTALLGTPAFLNFLTNVVTAVGTLPQQGLFRINTLLPGDIQYGQFLFASPLFHSANTGFNFSPSRDMSEAVFWNPSAIGNSRRSNNISLLTNLKNNVKLGGFTRLNNNFSLGAGGIYTWQEELRSATFGVGTTPPIPSDSVKMKLKEYAAFISPVYRINNKFSIGLAAKSLWQTFTTPISVNIGSGKSDFTDTTIKSQHFDVDFSATYKVSPSFQVGLNAMNLAGTELYSDAFVPGNTASFQNQRSLGLGLCYKNKRWNIGTDLLFTQDDFYDASVGVNYVPFNNALLSAGLAVKQLSYSFAFRMKHFRIAYIDDNGFFANEIKKGKAAILNGRIYSGFIFDFD